MFLYCLSAGGACVGVVCRRGGVDGVDVDVDVGEGGGGGGSGDAGESGRGGRVLLGLGDVFGGLGGRATGKRP